MRREKLEHLVTIGMIEGKLSRRKHRQKMLDGLTKWLNVGPVTDAVKLMRDRDVWKVMKREQDAYRARHLIKGLVSTPDSTCYLPTATLI